MVAYVIPPREEQFIRALHDHINEKLDKGFKIALPEWNRIDTTVTAVSDPISGKMRIRVDFLFEPNGLS